MEYLDKGRKREKIKKKTSIIGDTYANTYCNGTTIDIWAISFLPTDASG